MASVTPLGGEELNRFGYTDDAEIYEVLEPDSLNPEYPVRLHLDITGRDLAPVLHVRQPGPWLDGEPWEQIFVDLDALIALGKLAEALKSDG